MYTYKKVISYIFVNNISLLAAFGFYFILDYMFGNEWYAIVIIFDLISLFIYAFFMIAWIRGDRKIDIRVEFEGEDNASFDISKYDSFGLVINGERFKLNKTEVNNFFKRDDSGRD